MQGKHLTVVALMSACSMFFIFMHLESEISRLDAARAKLGKCINIFLFRSGL